MFVLFSYSFHDYMNAPYCRHYLVYITKCHVLFLCLVTAFCYVYFPYIATWSLLIFIAHGINHSTFFQEMSIWEKRVVAPISVLVTICIVTPQLTLLSINRPTILPYKLWIEAWNIVRWEDCRMLCIVCINMHEYVPLSSPGVDQRNVGLPVDFHSNRREREREGFHRL